MGFVFGLSSGVAPSALVWAVFIVASGDTAGTSAAVPAVFAIVSRAGSGISTPVVPAALPAAHSLKRRSAEASQCSSVARSLHTPHSGGRLGI